MPGVRICAHTWVCVTFQRNDILSRANIIIVGLNGPKDSRVLVTAAWSSVKHIQVTAMAQWKKHKLCDHYVQYWNVKSSGHKRSVDIDPPQCWRVGAVSALNPKSETYIPSIYHLYTCLYTRRTRESKINAKLKTSHWSIPIYWQFWLCLKTGTWVRSIMLKNKSYRIVMNAMIFLLVYFIVNSWWHSFEIEITLRFCFLFMSI